MPVLLNSQLRSSGLIVEHSVVKFLQIKSALDVRDVHHCVNSLVVSQNPTAIWLKGEVLHEYLFGVDQQVVFEGWNFTIDGKLLAVIVVGSGW